MADLDAIGDISADEVDQLHHIGVRTIEELLTRIDELGIARVARQAGLTAADLRTWLPELRVANLPARPPAPGRAVAQQPRARVPTFDALWARLDASGHDMVAEDTGISTDRLWELVSGREARERDHRQQLAAGNVAALPGLPVAAATQLGALGATTVGQLWDLITTHGRAELATASGISAKRLRRMLDDERAKAVRARLQDADVPIEHFEDVTAPEGLRFRASGIATIGQARAYLAESGLDRLVRESGLGRRVLLDLLGRRATLEAERDRSPLARAWLPALLAVWAVVVLLLILRSTGLSVWGPAPIGGLRTVVVPKHDLTAGARIRAADLHVAVLPCPAGCFQSIAELEGLDLALAVRAGKAVRHRDVSRLQVTALKDVLARTVVGADALALAWTPYEPDALTRVDQVAGRTARHALHQGGVVHMASLDLSPAVARQVVVKRPAGLPAFVVIDTGDVELKDVPYEAGSFDSVEKVVGRFPLQLVLAEATLRAEHLGLVRLDPAALKGRSLLRVHLASSGLTVVTQPGDRVSLRPAVPNPSLVVKDAIVLATEQRSDGLAVVVAVPSAEVSKLKRLMATPSRFVVLPGS